MKKISVMICGMLISIVAAFSGCKHIEKVPTLPLENRQEEISAVSEISVNMEESETESSIPLEIAYYPDGTVSSIKGQWSDRMVLNSDDAFLSVTSVKDYLGLKDPEKELVLTATYSTGYQLLYIFTGVYQNIKVYESEVIISLDDNDAIPDYLEAYLIPEDRLQSTDFSENVSQEEIEQQYNMKNIQKYIYPYDEYEDSPIIVYVGKVQDETVIVSSQTGERIIPQEELMQGEESNAIY